MISPPREARWFAPLYTFLVALLLAVALALPTLPWYVCVVPVGLWGALLAWRMGWKWGREE